MNVIKLIKEMGNVSKRQQPDHRAYNSRQWVFNVARNSRTRKRPSAGTLKNMYTSTVIMDVILNSELYTRN